MGIPRHRYVVPETYVQLLYEYLGERGVDAEAVLGQPWPKVAPNSLGGVPVEDWERMLDAAERHLRDPLIALHLGQTSNLRHLGTLGLVLLACNNVAEALQRWEHYQRLIFDVQPLVVRAGKQGIQLVWEAKDHPVGRRVEETGTVVAVEFCRSLVLEACSPVSVSFTAPAPPPEQVRAFEEYFACPVAFGQPEQSICISPALLALPLKNPDPALIAVLEKHADELLARLPQDSGVVEQVRREISHLLREGEPDIARVSAVLGCSARTLQRRLTAANTSFRHELDLVRQELARGYLRDSRLQLVEIALLLGYSEHSAFTRAYGKWTGRTPQQEREAMAAGDT